MYCKGTLVWRHDLNHTHTPVKHSIETDFGVWYNDCSSLVLTGHLFVRLFSDISLHKALKENIAQLSKHSNFFSETDQTEATLSHYGRPRLLKIMFTRATFGLIYCHDENMSWINVKIVAICLICILSYHNHSQDTNKSRSPMFCALYTHHSLHPPAVRLWCEHMNIHWVEKICHFLGDRLSSFRGLYRMWQSCMCVCCFSAATAFLCCLMDTSVFQLHFSHTCEISAKVGKTQKGGIHAISLNWNH